MKNKNQKGITLISLVVTIVVLLILASIGTYSGINVINSSKLATFTAEMKVMQSQVNSLYEKYKSGEIIPSDIGKSIDATSINASKVDDIFRTISSDLGKEESKEGYRFYDKITLKELNIETQSQQFLINIEKRRVINYEGLKYDNKMYYMLEQLPNNLYNVELEERQYDKPTFDMKTELIGNNKWRITISNIKFIGNINKWQVQYQIEGRNDWNTTEDMSFVVNEPGKYNFRIVNGNVQSELIAKIIVENYISSGLILHYDGINNTGEGDDKHSTTTTTWKDLSGKGNDGELKGFNATETSGWKEKKLMLDGADDGIYLADKLINLYKNDATIELVLNFTNDNNRDIIIGNHSSQNSISIERGSGAGNYPLKGRIWYKAGTIDYITPDIYETKKDELVSYVFDKKKTTFNFLKNGQNMDSHSNGVFSENMDYINSWIGRDERTGTTCMNGAIYSVRIYDRILTEAEIQMNYEVDKKRFEI